MSSFSNVDPDEEWYYLDDASNEQEGPFKFDDFKRLLPTEKVYWPKLCMEPEFS